MGLLKYLTARVISHSSLIKVLNKVYLLALILPLWLQCRLCLSPLTSRSEGLVTNLLPPTDLIPRALPPSVFDYLQGNGKPGRKPGRSCHMRGGRYLGRCLTTVIHVLHWPITGTMGDEWHWYCLNCEYSGLQPLDRHYTSEGYWDPSMANPPII